MISVAGAALPLRRCRLPGTPSETSTPIGSAASAARSDSAAAVARHPISRNDSQSVRKCTPSTLRSMLRTSVVPSARPPTQSNAQPTPQARPPPRPNHQNTPGAPQDPPPEPTVPDALTEPPPPAPNAPNR